MRGSLFVKELKQYRASFLVWSLTIIGLTVATMAAMPVLLSNSAGMSAFLKAFPPEMMRAFSFSLSSLADPLGFYVVYSTIYVILMGSVFSISITAGILHKEQSLGTAEFLLAKPLTRAQISLTKIAAYLALVFALNVLTFLTAWLCLKGFSPLPFRLDALAIVSVYGLLLMLAMGGIGLLVSLFVKRSRSLTGPAIGIVLGFYLIDMAAKITSKYEAYGWMSPFKWVDLDVTRAGYGFDWWRLAMFASLILAGFAASVLVYREKDILT